MVAQSITCLAAGRGTGWRSLLGVFVARGMFVRDCYPASCQLSSWSEVVARAVELVLVRRMEWRAQDVDSR